jgi:hypothetical protein
MSLNEPEKPKKGWGCLIWSVVLVVGMLLLLTLIPAYGQNSHRANQMMSGSNARQIIALLLTYASDNNGQFPDAKMNASGLTSNEVFRELFKEKLIEDESIFGCPMSSFIPDRQIGTAPDYKQALEPGENHWMMAAGLDEASVTSTPLLLENAVDATWPPRWLPRKNPLFLTKLIWVWFPPPPPPLRPRGGSWPGNVIIVGYPDASLGILKLEVKSGYAHYPASLATPPLKLLDIEEKP